MRALWVRARALCRVLSGGLVGRYMLFCLSFPGSQWVFGCQCVQIALWCGAGTSKLGPWFKYVIGDTRMFIYLFIKNLILIARM